MENGPKNGPKKIKNRPFDVWLVVFGVQNSK